MLNWDFNFSIGFNCPPLPFYFLSFSFGDADGQRMNLNTIFGLSPAGFMGSFGWGDRRLFWILLHQLLNVWQGVRCGVGRRDVRLRTEHNTTIQVVNEIPSLQQDEIGKEPNLFVITNIRRTNYRPDNRVRFPKLFSLRVLGTVTMRSSFELVLLLYSNFSGWSDSHSAVSHLPTGVQKEAQWNWFFPHCLNLAILFTNRRAVWLGLGGLLYFFVWFLFNLLHFNFN